MFSLWTRTKLNHHLLTITHRHTALSSDSQPRQPDECKRARATFRLWTRYHCRPELLRSSCDHAKRSVTVDKYVQHWINGRVGPVRQCDVLGAEFQLPLEGVSEAGSAGSRGIYAGEGSPTSWPAIWHMHDWLGLPAGFHFFRLALLVYIWARLFRHATGELGLAAQMSEVGE